MPDRVRIYVPSETLADGDLVELYGPDATGAIDWTAPIAGGRAAVQRGVIGRGRNTPAGFGPAGIQARAVELRSGPLVFGSKTFGVKTREPEGGQAADTIPGTVSIFVNAAPVPSTNLLAVEALVGGQLRFTFAAGGFA